MLIEGAGIDWSVIFMRDMFNTPPFLNGTALFLGAGSQFLVRFYADNIVEKFGSKNVARISIIGMFIGLIFTGVMFYFVFFRLNGDDVSYKDRERKKLEKENLKSLVFFTLLFAIAIGFSFALDESASVTIWWLNYRVDFSLVVLAVVVVVSFIICFPLLFLSWFFISSIDKKKL